MHGERYPFTDKDYQRLAAQLTRWWQEYGYWGEGMRARWLEVGDLILFMDEIWRVVRCRTNEAIMRSTSTTYTLERMNRKEYITITNVPDGDPHQKITTIGGQECEITLLPTLSQLLNIMDQNWPDDREVGDHTGPYVYHLVPNSDTVVRYVAVHDGRDNHVAGYNGRSWEHAFIMVALEHER